MPRRRAPYRTGPAAQAAGGVAVPGVALPVEVAFVPRWGREPPPPRPGVVRLVVGPAPVPEGLLPEAGVVLCGSPGLREGGAVREPAAAYAGAGASTGEGLPLAEAVAASGVRVAPRLALPGPDRWPEALSRLFAALRDAAAAGAARYAEALAAALGLETAPPLRLLGRRLAEAVAGVPPAARREPHLLPAVARLEALAAAPDPETFLLACRPYHDPWALMEEVALLRLAAASPADAAALAAMRRYLEGAALPEAQAELAVDRTLVLEQLSPEAVQAEPHRLAGIRAAFDLFRSRYYRLYVEHHRRYQEGLARLQERLAAAGPQAAALARLNGLAELGPPLGAAALQSYARWRTEAVPCPQPTPPEDEPRCPACRLPLDAVPPLEAAERDLARLHAALAQQLRRLSRRAVRRVLDREGHARLDRLLQAARASDLAGLAALLDDDLTAFLRDFLREPPPDPGVLAGLAAAHPEVTEQDVDAAVETFRRLLRAALDAAQGPPGSRRVRLAPPGPP